MRNLGMWGATFVSTKVLLSHFSPVEVLMTRAVLAFLALFLFFPHHLKLHEVKTQNLLSPAQGFVVCTLPMLENTALTITYASNVRIIVTCAPFFCCRDGKYFLQKQTRCKLLYWICNCYCGSYTDQPEWQEYTSPESSRRFSGFACHGFLGNVFCLCKRLGNGTTHDCCHEKNLFLRNHILDSRSAVAGCVLGCEPV